MRRLFLTTTLLLALSLVLAGVVSASVNQSPSNVTTGLNTGLVGWWTMDGADSKSGTSGYLVDKSGNNKTVTRDSGTPTAVNGKIGQGFSVKNAFFSTSNTSTLNNLTALSISGWVKLFSAPALVGGIAGISGPGTLNDGYGLDYTAGQFQLFINNWASNQAKKTQAADGKWHHVVGTWDGQTTKIYVDTVKGTDGTISSYSFLAGQPFQVGAVGGFMLNSHLDDVRVYNRALSPSEISQLYKQGGGKIASSPPSITNGLVGWWTFDGNDVNLTGGVRYAIDKSGNGNNASSTVAASNPAIAMGKIGQALSFDGNSDYLSVSHSNSVTYDGDGTFSWGGWFKPLESSLVAYSYISKDNGGITAFRNSNYTIWLYVQQWNCAMGNDTVYDNAVFPTNVTNGKWYHVMCVRNSDGLHIYVNGVKGTSDTSLITGYTVETLPLKIGKPGSGIAYPKGPMDDIRVYSRALSPSEISQLYKQGVAGKTNQSPTNVTTNLNTGLVGWWTFDGADSRGTTYGSNVLVDGNMESAGTTAWGTFHATLSKETTNPHGGSQVLRMAYLDDGQAYAKQTVLTVGKTYRMTGWGRSDGTAGPSISTGGSTIWAGSASTNWQYFDITRTITAGDGVLIYFGTSNAAAGRYVEFDNVTVVEVTPAYALDKSGNNNTATAPATALMDVAKGKIGQAMKFSGTNSYVSTTDSAALRISNSITLSTWVKSLGTNSNSGLIYKGSFSSIQGDYELVLASGILNFDFNSAAQRIVSTGALVAPIGKWTHLVATYDGTNMLMYVDGILKTSSCGIGTCTGFAINTSASQLVVGGYYSSNYLFTGLMDDTRIYNRALTQAEVTQLYKQGK